MRRSIAQFAATRQVTVETTTTVIICWAIELAYMF